jgi:hypothetical protein
VRYEPRPGREDRQRIWIVSVSFFEKNRWTPDKELKARRSASS